MNMWLVINGNKQLPYDEQYRIFSDPEKAYQAALNAGFDENMPWARMGHPADMNTGSIQVSCGPGVDLTVIRLEVS